MPLLFKIQNSVVTFSLKSILNVRVPDIPKLLKNVKGYLYYKTFEERSEIRKINMFMSTV